MSIITYAAIDIGSYEIAMKVYEISPKSTIREIDFIRHSIDMGTETYTTGKLSYERVEELCRILLNFRTIMDSYQITDYGAFATSAFREAKNAAILLDQIKTRTKIRITILSNSEQRLFHYKAAAFKEKPFAEAMKKGAAIIDIGGGSIQISLFEKDILVSTQNLRLGVLRLRELLTHLDVIPAHYESLLNEIIESQMAEYKKLYLTDKTIKNVVIIDDYISDIIVRGDKGYSKKYMLQELLIACNAAPHSQLAKRFAIPEENIILLQISGTLLKRIMDMMNAENIWAPGTTLCDGAAYDYAVKKKIITPHHNFEQDIIACARNISSRYHGSKPRSETMEAVCLAIFDSIKNFHGMGKRERLLLRLSAILHDCGKYISMVNLSESSYNIVMATEIIGLSQNERIIVANVVKYNHQDDDYLDNFINRNEAERITYLIIAKLTAILGLANGLDISNKQKFKNLKAVLKEGELILTVDTDMDITLEKGLLKKSVHFFSEVFNIRPVIRRKRIFKR